MFPKDGSTQKAISHWFSKCILEGKPPGQLFAHFEAQPHDLIAHALPFQSAGIQAGIRIAALNALRGLVTDAASPWRQEESAVELLMFIPRAFEGIRDLHRTKAIELLWTLAERSNDFAELQYYTLDSLVCLGEKHDQGKWESFLPNETSPEFPEMLALVTRAVLQQGLEAFFGWLRTRAQLSAGLNEWTSVIGPTFRMNRFEILQTLRSEEAICALERNSSYLHPVVAQDIRSALTEWKYNIPAQLQVGADLSVSRPRGSAFTVRAAGGSLSPS
jgi:hypothetical protein